MNYTDIILERKEFAGWIILNKPHVLNALGRQTLLDILAALGEYARDSKVMVVVVTGAGKAFCAGVDLKEHAQRVDDLPEKFEFTALADRVFNTLENFPKVTVAMVNGVCMAGGFELALTCDFIIAGENCQMGDGHIKTGLIPNGGASIRLPRQIGLRKAKELLYTGELVSGKEAERIGLVTRAVPENRLKAAVEELIAKLVDKPPLALQAVKMLVNQGTACSLEAGLQLEHQAVQFLQTTEDFKESMAAFAEKRRPVYKGR